MARLVKDVMTSDPATVAPNMPLTEAAATMRDGHTGDVLIAEGGRLTGVLTDRDIVVRVVAESRDPGSMTAADACSDDLVTLSPGEDSDHAVRLMRKHALRRLPVVDDGKLIGIVALGDLAVEKDEQSALADISAAQPNT